MMNFFIMNKYMEYNSLFIVNVALVCLSLSSIVVLLFMIHENNILSEQINDEVKEIEKKCPHCVCPECPKTPDVSCPKCPQCPQCPQITEDIRDNIKELLKNKNNNVDSVNNNVNQYPTVDEIVSAIFPGRNPKAISGRYFQVDPSNTYDGLSTDNFYDKNYKFPIDKILNTENSLNSYNINKDDIINNSINNQDINTSNSELLNNEKQNLINENVSNVETIKTNNMNNINSSDMNSIGSPPKMNNSDIDSFYQKILPDNIL